jgi:hypothetical protein
MKGTFVTGLLWSGALALTGCTSEVGDLLECTMVCEHYDDCVGDAYDATQCIDECESAADADPAWGDRVRACDECLDDAACSAACNEACAGIIPAFPES